MIKKTLYALLLIALVPVMCLAQSGKNRHVVQSNETLYRIGLKYGISVAELYSLNPGAEKGIHVGQTLYLPDRLQLQQQQDTERFHSVKAGETLYSISKQYGVSVDAIRNANPDLGDLSAIPIGVIIKIPLPGSTFGAGKSENMVPGPPVSPTKQVTGLAVMTVAPKQTVYSILKMTGWSEEVFYHYNPHVRSGLKAGQTVFVPDTKLSNNQATTPTPEKTPGRLEDNNATNVVLALPFEEDTQHRFSDYYKGFLLTIKSAKMAGATINLHVLDCGKTQLSNTLNKIQSLPKVDLIIGGVSNNSVARLAKLSGEKGALYVVPFSSKDLSVEAMNGARIYQVNTPHRLLYEVAAEKFMSQYQGYEVHFVQFGSDTEEKGDFVYLLKQKLVKAGRSYTESPSTSGVSTLAELVRKTTHTVVVPTSSSFAAAQSTLAAVTDAVGSDDSEGSEKITVFGYPEWQTYTSQLEALFHRTGATFYTTFFPNPMHRDYRAFEREFITWFGHGVGTTFPRYSILGYDTGYYFLAPGLNSALTQKSSGNRHDSLYEGIQSTLDFRQQGNKNLYSNQGVFFVTYNRNDRSTSIN